MRHPERAAARKKLPAALLKKGTARNMIVIDRIALILAIIGGINWGSIGLFRFDIVAWLCGGQTSVVSRIIYTLVGLAALWCISLLARSRDSERDGSGSTTAARQAS